MLTLWGRRSELSVYPVVRGTPQESKGRSFKNLRVVFNLSKTIEKDKSGGNIEVYNLSDTSRAEISDAGDQRVILKVGYKPHTPDPSGGEIGIRQLYVGDVMYVEHQYQAPDWITRFQTISGMYAMRDVRIDSPLISEAGNPTPQAILTKVFDLLKDKGIEVPKSINDVIPAGALKKYSGGFSYSGGVREIIDILTTDLHVEWSLSDNRIRVTQFGEPSTEGVSIDGAMLGTPQRTRQQVQTPSGEMVNKKGYNLKMLLNFDVQPGIGIEIPSLGASAKFRVEKVRHNGDTHGQQWETTAEVMDLANA